MMRLALLAPAVLGVRVTGFHVLAVVPHYLKDDPASLGYAAVIEWLNPETIVPEMLVERPTQFLHKDVLKHLERLL